QAPAAGVGQAFNNGIPLYVNNQPSPIARIRQVYLWHTNRNAPDRDSAIIVADGDFVFNGTFERVPVQTVIFDNLPRVMYRGIADGNTDPALIQPDGTYVQEMNILEQFLRTQRARYSNLDDFRARAPLDRSKGASKAQKYFKAGIDDMVADKIKRSKRARRDDEDDQGVY
ncbi:hypothetical protein T439DRAFT_330456, partial [Meredithblackwellia eburnea MCA 4105]